MVAVVSMPELERLVVAASEDHEGLTWYSSGSWPAGL
jgi:hypothetical protein